VKVKVAAALLITMLGDCTAAEAATRTCTLDERALADARLLEIANDELLQSQLIHWHLPFGVPVATHPIDNERLLVQGGYVMDHDDDLRVAVWVGYRLTAKDRIDAKGKDRVNCFRRDPRIPTALTGDPSDYNEPRFDQGHMANDADLKDDLVEQLNSYVMSNIAPQECRLNRGIWLSLESLTRDWASMYDTIYVMSGAIFDRDGDSVRDDDSDAQRMESRNGLERVAVPSQFFKIIVRRDDEGYKSITFLIENTNDPHGATWVAVRPDILQAVSSIEQVEDLGDLILFPDLNRNRLIESFAGEGWAFESGDSNLENTCH